MDGGVAGGVTVGMTLSFRLSLSSLSFVVADLETLMAADAYLLLPSTSRISNSSRDMVPITPRLVHIVAMASVGLSALNVIDDGIRSPFLRKVA